MKCDIRHTHVYAAFIKLAYATRDQIISGGQAMKGDAGQYSPLFRKLDPFPCGSVFKFLDIVPDPTVKHTENRFWLGHHSNYWSIGYEVVDDEQFDDIKPKDNGEHLITAFKLRVDSVGRNVDILYPNFFFELLGDAGKAASYEYMLRSRLYLSLSVAVLFGWILDCFLFPEDMKRHIGTASGGIGTFDETVRFSYWNLEVLLRDVNVGNTTFVSWRNFFYANEEDFRVLARDFAVSLLAPDYVVSTAFMQQPHLISQEGKDVAVGVLSKDLTIESEGIRQTARKQLCPKELILYTWKRMQEHQVSKKEPNDILDSYIDASLELDEELDADEK